MVMTVMSVATPMVNPSMVREARILCARSALKHCARLSRTASMSGEQASNLRLPRDREVGSLNLLIHHGDNETRRKSSPTGPSCGACMAQAQNESEHRRCRRLLETGPGDEAAPIIRS